MNAIGGAGRQREAFDQLDEHRRRASPATIAARRASELRQATAAIARQPPPRGTGRHACLGRRGAQRHTVVQMRPDHGEAAKRVLQALLVEHDARRGVRHAASVEISSVDQRSLPAAASTPRSRPRMLREGSLSQQPDQERPAAAGHPHRLLTP
jgi:hypothetical protein